MVAAISTSPLIPLAAAAAAVYCIIVLQVKNGFFPMMTALGKEAFAHPRSASIESQLNTIFAGDSLIKTHIAGLVRFFYPITTGENPRLSLFSFWAAGQILALHTLLVLEGLRAGNRGRLISYTAVWGFIYQNIPFGIVLPVWLALWLWTSPIARMSAATPKPVLAQALGIGNADLAVVVHAMVWGFIVPTTMSGLPSSSVQTTQRWILAWQLFPVYVGVARFVLSRAVQIFGGVHNSVPAPPPADPKKPGPTLTRRLRAVYFPVLVATSVVHTLTLIYVFWPHLRPAALDAPGVDLVSLFKPVSRPGHVVPVTTVAEGALSLLQWDVYFASGAMLFWASQVYWASTTAPSLTSILTVLAGPGGAALALVWRRDEHLLLGNAPKEKDY